jgi:feruloyl esterase
MITILALLLAGTSAATPCEGLKALSLPQTSITTANFVAAGPAIPAYCRVTMVLAPSSDSAIKVELWMPAENWNGKFLGVGNGGWGGSIQGYGEMQNALRFGYATAGTDTGHSGSSDNGDFAFGHPEKFVDFAYRAIHEMTAKSKLVLNAFYEQPLMYSYFKGCSTGGRQALMEAQRHPEDYDGIIAGAPSARQSHDSPAALALGNQIVRNPDQAISQVQADLVSRTVINACDTLKEGFLNNPRQCKVDFSKLQCAAGVNSDKCLTQAQIKTVETFYGGVKNSKGELILSGMPLGVPIGPQLSTQPPVASYSVRIAFGDPTYVGRTFDLDRDMKLIDERIGFVNAVNPDLSRFKAHGGKLLLYQGWRDPQVTAEGTIWYFDSVLDKMGKGQSDWLRLLLLPGMDHCGGGPGPNATSVPNRAIPTVWQPSVVLMSRDVDAKSQTLLRSKLTTEHRMGGSCLLHSDCFPRTRIPAGRAGPSRGEASIQSPARKAG